MTIPTANKLDKLPKTELLNLLKTFEESGKNRKLSDEEYYLYYSDEDDVRNAIFWILKENEDEDWYDKWIDIIDEVFREFIS